MNGSPSAPRGLRGLLSRGLEARVAGLRRDLGMLARSLSGAPAPPLVRTGTRPAATAPDDQRLLTVTAIVPEGDDAVRIHLAKPSGELRWEAGQFLTLFVEIDGVRHRRAYSIATAPGAPGDPCIVVKRVPGGVVSNRLVDSVAVGQRLIYRGPSGRFLVPRGAAPAAHHVLIGGGSGITPLAAIAATLLRDAPAARVTLLYGNRSPRDIILHDALQELARAHPDRFQLRLFVEAEAVDGAHHAGRLDAAVVGRELGRLDLDDAYVYVCGPEGMMDAARDALGACAFPADRHLEERFVSLATTSAPGVAPAAATIRKGDASWDLIVPRGRTLLDAGLAVGAELPSSCTMGGCGACRVRLIGGEVVMDEPNCLSQGERDDGYILACVSHPLGPVVVEVPT